VATAAGVLLMLDWRLGVATLLVWIAVAAIGRISSLAALAAAVAAPVICFLLLPGRPAIFGTVLLIAALLIQRHKRNLLNLIAGTEGRIGEKAKPKA
jgi:glycerol-3-phosphate acyltransferase PlsY